MRGSPELADVLRDAFSASVQSGLTSKMLPI
jgi:hypothetical protein